MSSYPQKYLPNTTNVGQHQMYQQYSHQAASINLQTPQLLTELAETYLKTVKEPDTFNNSVPSFTSSQKEYSEVLLFLRQAPISVTSNLPDLRWALFVAMTCDLLVSNAVYDAEEFINAFKSLFPEMADQIAKLLLLHPSSPDLAVYCKNKLPCHCSQAALTLFLDFCADHNLRHVQRAIISFFNVLTHTNSTVVPSLQKHPITCDIPPDYRLFIRDIILSLQKQTEVTKVYEQQLMQQQSACEQNLAQVTAQYQQVKQQRDALHAQLQSQPQPQLAQQVQQLEQQLQQHEMLHLQHMKQNQHFQNELAACRNTLSQRLSRVQTLEKHLLGFPKVPQNLDYLSVIHSNSGLPYPSISPVLARTLLADLFFRATLTPTEPPSALAMTILNANTTTVLASAVSAHGIYTAISCNDNSVRIWRHKEGHGYEHTSSLATRQAELVAQGKEPTTATTPALLAVDSLFYHDWAFTPGLLHSKTLECCLCVDTCVCRQKEYRFNIGKKVSCMEFTRNEEYLLLGTRCGYVYLIQLSTMIILYTYKYTDTESDRNTAITSLAWSPRDAYFAVGTIDGRIRLCSPSGKEAIRIYRHYTCVGPVTSLSFHPNGQYIAAGIRNNVCVYQLSGCQLVSFYMYHNNEFIRSICYSPLGDTLASVDLSGKLCVYNLLEETMLFTISPDTFYVPVASDVDKDANTVVYHTEPIEISPTESCVRPCCPNGTSHLGPIYTCHYSACGKYLATGSADSTVKIWSIEKRLPVVSTPQGNTPLLQQARMLEERLVKTYYTKSTKVNLVRFTPKNLLLTVGTFINPLSSQ